MASNEIVTLVKIRMAGYEQVLKSGVGFFNASPNVSRNEWKIFIQEQKLDENFRGIQGVGYSEVVLPKNKNEYEERIKKEGFPNFKIHPAGSRELYTSIIYLEPFDERNKRAFGYDMFSEKVRREAMSNAVQSGKATLSGKIKLVQEFSTDVQAGFLMYLPVYKKGFNLDTPSNKSSAIQGFVYAPFRANDLIDGIWGNMFHKMDFEIYDGNSTNDANILYTSNNQNNSTFYKTINITINGRVWTLAFKEKSILNSEEIYIIILVPSLFMLLTLLLYLLLNSVIKTKENALQLAKKTTLKLHISEERLRFALEGTGDGLWDWNIKTNEVFFSKRWKEMLGYKEHEIASTLDEWKNRIYPDDLARVNFDKYVIYSTADLDGNIHHASNAFYQISGYSKDELIGKKQNIVSDEDTPDSTYQDLWNTIKSGKIWQGEIKNRHKNGSFYWVNSIISPIKNEQGEITYYTSIQHDITDKKHVEQLSITDKLTQLYNRLKLDEIFSMQLASARRYNTPLSVIIIDIDHFKRVNDTWGHQAGDEILKEFAKIIKDNSRETDVIGRWGGEEFLILSSDIDLNGAVELSEKLRNVISLFKFSFVEHKTASFGVSSYHVGDDEETLINRAGSLALYDIF